MSPEPCSVPETWTLSPAINKPGAGASRRAGPKHFVRRRLQKSLKERSLCKQRSRTVSWSSACR